MSWFKTIARRGLMKTIARRRLVKEEGGFTLVELMVVIAVLGVLAAVVVPNFVGIVGGAQTQANAAETSTIQSALDAYMGNHKLVATTITDIAAGTGDVTPDPADTFANGAAGSLKTYWRTPPHCAYTVNGATGTVTQVAGC